MREEPLAPRMVRAAAIALAVLGVTVIIGWTFEIEALKRVLPDANSMKVTTALGFLLAALSLWFAASQRTDARANFARRWAPALIGALGAAALFEYATGVDLGINELFFDDRSEFNQGAPGRMAVITAVLFVVFAATFWIPRARTPRNNIAFLTCASIGFAAATLATIGYLYQLQLLYRPLPESAIAVHTAFGFVIAFSGVFATRADIGWLGLMHRGAIANVLGRLLLPIVILVPLALGWAAIGVVNAGWLDGRTALALLSLITIAILVIVIGRAAARLSKLEQTVRRREEIYASVTENALDAFMLADADGRILDWNPQAERMFGWTRDEVLGRIVREVIMPEAMRDAYAAGLDRYKSGGDYDMFGRRVEVPAIRRDGAVLTVELIAIPIRNDGELFFGLFCRDMTDVRAAEDQLRQAQKMEAVGRLTGGIAHDFNNTLTAIIATLDTAIPRAPEALRPRIQIALHAAERAALMIKQLLAFSRKQMLKAERLKLNEVVSHAADMLNPTLGERVEIILHLSDDVPDAVADASQLESAILNLSINARDAMPDGGKLTIETGRATLDAVYASQNPDVSPGPYAMVAISDTGSGMDAKTLERVFEPFFTTKGADRGSGLGLSMVHGFAKQSGGHVKIYSEPGHGTTVRLYLPLADAKDAQASIEPLSPTQHGGRETILLVEDNPLVRTVAVGALRDLGYTVIAMSSGKEALAHLRTGATADLLFTDIVMPDMTGVELADVVAREYPELRISFTSGYSDAALAQNGNLRPNSRFLAKPYRTHDLAVHIREALDMPRPRAARTG